MLDCGEVICHLRLSTDLSTSQMSLVIKNDLIVIKSALSEKLQLKT